METIKIRRLISVLCLGLTIATACDTANNVDLPDEHYFMKLYGEDGDQSGVDMVALPDGNFLLLGNSELNDEKKLDLLKVDPEGQILWQRKYGSITDVAVDIEAIGDGNFVILSSFTNPLNQSSDVKLMRITPNGDKIDSVMYGTTANDFPRSVTPLLDGGFIVSGFSELGENLGFGNIFHYRCTANLVFLDDSNAWISYYGSVGEIDRAIKVFQIEDDRFYVFSYSTQLYPGKLSKNSNFQYYSINATGTANNPAYIGGDTRNLSLSFVCQLSDELAGGFLLLGTEVANGGATDMFVSKLRSDLIFDGIRDDVLGENVFAGTRTQEAVSAAPCLVSPGFLLLSNEKGTSGTNIWLTKIDQSANIQWSVSLGSKGLDDTAAAVRELPDGRILVLGTVVVRANQTKMAFFKLNSNGRLQE
jgi:hypothetical protein